MPREGDTKIRDGYIWEYKLTFVDDEDDEEFEWVNTGVREEVVSESDNAHPDRYATDQEIYDSSITDEEIYEREKLKLESERRRDKARKRIEDEARMERVARNEARIAGIRPSSPSRLSKIFKGIYRPFTDEGFAFFFWLGIAFVVLGGVLSAILGIDESYSASIGLGCCGAALLVTMILPMIE